MLDFTTFVLRVAFMRNFLYTLRVQTTRPSYYTTVVTTRPCIHRSLRARVFARPPGRAMQRHQENAIFFRRLFICFKGFYTNSRWTCSTLTCGGVYILFDPDAAAELTAAIRNVSDCECDTCTNKGNWSCIIVWFVDNVHHKISWWKCDDAVIVKFVVVFVCWLFVRLCHPSSDWENTSPYQHSIKLIISVSSLQW